MTSLDIQSRDFDGVCGIYRASHKNGDVDYIGSSINIGRRFREHLHHLRTCNHACRRWQMKWDQSQGVGWTFELLESCTPAELESRERYWINRHPNFLNEQHNPMRKAGRRKAKIKSRPFSTKPRPAKASAKEVKS